MTYRRIAMVAVMLVTAVLVQTVVLTRIPFPGATPDLVLLVALSIALVQGPTRGAVVCFAAGLLLDVVPPADGAVGRWALVLCVVGWFVGRASDMVEGSAVLPLLVVAGAVVVSLFGYAVVGWLIGDARVTASAVTSSMPPAVLYDVLFSPFVVPLVMGLARRFEVTSTYARTVR
jgi:rod shape-determining protein MreD